MTDFRIDSHVKPPKAKRKRVFPLNVSSALVAYSAAYKGVYGVLPPASTYDKATALIHVGKDAGVSLMRLKELTRMLKARVE
jgi:hypothetical protein